MPRRGFLWALALTHVVVALGLIIILGTPIAAAVTIVLIAALAGTVSILLGRAWGIYRADTLLDDAVRDVGAGELARARLTIINAVALNGTLKRCPELICLYEIIAKGEVGPAGVAEIRKLRAAIPGWDLRRKNWKSN